MLGFGHQTIFGLCMALLVLAAVSVVCVALLFIERQDINLLHQHVTSFPSDEIPDAREENKLSNRLVTQQEAAARSSD